MASVQHGVLHVTSNRLRLKSFVPFILALSTLSLSTSFPTQQAFCVQNYHKVSWFNGIDLCTTNGDAILQASAHLIQRQTISSQLYFHPLPMDYNSPHEMDRSLSLSMARGGKKQKKGGRGKNNSDDGEARVRYTKGNLPVKTCVVCGRPFEWRKKWERCWDEVSTCSKSCNAQRRSNKNIVEN